VRRLRPGDEVRVVRAARLFDDPPKLAASRAYLQDERNVFLLAEEGRTAVGFLRATELPQLKSRRPQMFLYEISVASASRRTGVGRRLVLWLLRYCRARRFEEVFVLTDPANTAAVRLYETAGGVTETAGDRMYVSRL
jgi:ribosomal protein S18 acetylase RimI-like enzyme